VARIPLEELRARVEYLLKRIPRLYRVDWLREAPYTARISFHRDVSAEVERALREMGARIVEERPVAPPMRVLVVDFSEATPPPVMIGPELERYLLWSKFSAALMAAGADPEVYRDRFEEALRATEGRPLEEKQKVIEELARGIVEALRAPPKIPLALERYEEELKRYAVKVAREVGLTPARARSLVERLWEDIRRALKEAKVRTPDEAREIIRRLVEPEARALLPPPAPPTEALRQIVREEVREALREAALPGAMPPVTTERLLDPATGLRYIAPTREAVAILRVVIPLPEEYFRAPPWKQVKMGWGTLWRMIGTVLEYRERYLNPMALALMPWLPKWLEEMKRELEENERIYPPEMLTRWPELEEAYNKLVREAIEVAKSVWMRITGEPPPSEASVYYTYVLQKIEDEIARLAFMLARREISQEEAEQEVRAMAERVAEVEAREVYERRKEAERRLGRGS